MNKKAQFFGIIFLLLGFFLFYFLIGYSLLTEVSMNMIEENQLDGLEAFLVANMNVWVVIIALMSSLVAVFVGGAQ